MDVITKVPEEQLEDLPLASLKRKTQFSGTVIKTTMAGAIVDIGIGTPGAVHISQLQQEPVNRVEDVVKVGQNVDVWVRRVFPKRGRIELTMIPPLVLEWREIEPGMVVKGTVVRLEKYGAFVDIGAERPGLVHISELSHEYVKGPGEVVKEGDQVEVKVLKVSRKKKQIKLSIKALKEAPPPPEKPLHPLNKSGYKKVEAESEAKNTQKGNEAEVQEEHIPTAMEMAIRKAMEQTHTHEDYVVKPERKLPRKDSKLGDILAQTLQSRPSD
jgi:small subunit ribosomal protein S1